MMHVHVSAEKVVKACDAILGVIAEAEGRYPQEDADFKARAASDAAAAGFVAVRRSADKKRRAEAKQHITLMRSFALASTTGDVLMDMEEFDRIFEYYHD